MDRFTTDFEQFGGLDESTEHRNGLYGRLAVALTDGYLAVFCGFLGHHEIFVEVGLYSFYHWPIIRLNVLPLSGIVSEFQNPSTQIAEIELATRRSQSMPKHRKPKSEKERMELLQRFQLEDPTWDHLGKDAAKQRKSEELTELLSVPVVDRFRGGFNLLDEIVAHEKADKEFRHVFASNVSQAKDLDLSLIHI